VGGELPKTGGLGREKEEMFLPVIPEKSQTPGGVAMKKKKRPQVVGRRENKRDNKTVVICALLKHRWKNSRTQKVEGRGGGPKEPLGGYNLVGRVEEEREKRGGWTETRWRGETRGKDQLQRNN